MPSGGSVLEQTTFLDFAQNNGHLFFAARAFHQQVFKHGLCYVYVSIILSYIFQDPPVEAVQALSQELLGVQIDPKEH